MIGAAAKSAPEGSWRLPYELALACSSSAMRRVVADRRERGDRPVPLATIFARGDRLFAIVDFHGGGRPGVFFPLDVWLDPR